METCQRNGLPKKADSFRQNHQTPWSCWHKWVSSSSRWCLLGSLCNSARQTSLHPPKGSCHHQNHWQCEHFETTLFSKQLHRHSPYHLWDFLGSNWFCSQPPQSPGGQVETRARKFPGRNLTSQSVMGTSVQTSWLFSTQVFLFRCLGSGTKQFQMSTLKLCSPAHFFLVVHPCSWIETQNIEALFCWVLDPLVNNHREWKLITVYSNILRGGLFSYRLGGLTKIGQHSTLKISWNGCNTSKGKNLVAGVVTSWLVT